MKRLIISADDFGLSPGTNRGILEAFKEGVVTSTSLFANMEGFDDAVAAVRGHPELPVGVHLNLVWGRPVSAPEDVPSLLDEGGRLLGKVSALAGRYWAGRLDPKDARLELVAQMRRVVEAGIRPTHLDTHKHCHCLGWVLDLVLEVAEAFGITRCRLPLPCRLPASEAHRLSWRTRVKTQVLARLAGRRRAMLEKRHIKTPQGICGQVDLLDEDALIAVFAGVERGVTELVCHPGYVDDTMTRFSGIPPHRGVERLALTSDRVRDAVAAAGLELVDYSSL